MTAFLNLLIAPVLATLAKNWLAIAVKATPVVVLLVLFAVEYLTGNAWTHWRAGLIAVMVAVLCFELMGKLNIASQPPRS